MPDLPINLDDLLRQRTVEGEQIEYKVAWNMNRIERIQRELPKSVAYDWRMIGV